MNDPTTSHPVPNSISNSIPNLNLDCEFIQDSGGRGCKVLLKQRGVRCSGERLLPSELNNQSNYSLPRQLRKQRID